MQERLQKILSAAGIASRRHAEDLIREGRVTVNGAVVRELGTKADAEHDAIKVDGRRVREPAAKVYILLNKPREVVSTASDPEGRAKVTDLTGVKGRIYPVGRLDYQTEGLILLTNDGAFARIVTEAGKIPKVYHAKVKGTPDEAALERLRAGIRLRDGTRLAPSKIERLRAGGNSWHAVTLVQGRNQQVRRMFEAIGHPVLKLRRVAIGALTPAGLPIGRWRHLTPGEVARIMKVG